MKKGRIGFAALVAILAMSFTIASHSKVFKKRDMANCYTIITIANYLSACNNPGTYTAITCSNKGSALGKVLKDDLFISLFSSKTVTSGGGNTLCCISLKSQTANPCISATHELISNGLSWQDNTGATIASGNYILVNDIQCKF